jgi:dienelactone hydrolase
MRFSSETTANGIVERRFAHADVPGVLWTAPGDASARPLVLLAHGGGQHKAAPGMVGRAHRFVAAGFAAASIDAPGHGERPRTDSEERVSAEIRSLVAAGEPAAGYVARYHAEVAPRAVPEWTSTVDELWTVGIGTDRPVGFFGISMGTGIGVPLVAAEPRIAAAVFGLAGHEGLADAASRVRVPVEFLVQWDDEMVPRESALALFDAFGSAEKTLHANTGPHADVPRFEVDSAVRFFVRHLLP